MNDKEYTYDIDKYTIGVDSNGEDGIGMTIAIIKNGEINFLGNCYGENARCIDLLIKENQALKKQLEDKEDYINKLQVTKDKLDKWDYENTMQQKDFINYLEDEIQQQETVMAENQEKLYFFKYEDEKEDLKLSSQKAYIRRIILEEILQKYKEITQTE